MSYTKSDTLFGLIDCNNFFVSCEKVFKPHLEGTPVVVLSSNDGCVISRSNEAKALGITMGEPVYLREQFFKRYNVTAFSSNFSLYGDLSERVMTTIANHISDIEIYSIDEAFINLSEYTPEEAEKIALHLKKTIRQWTGIPVCIGIAPTKTLAKIANRIAKKHIGGPGVAVLTGDETIRKALAELPVENIWGIGRHYGPQLKNYGIRTALDLYKLDDKWIQKQLSIIGLRMVRELRGISCLPLDMALPPKQAICTARSFGKKTSDFSQIREAVATYTSSCAEKLRQEHGLANLITIFIESHHAWQHMPGSNFCKVVHLPNATNSTLELVRYAVAGLETLYKEGFVCRKAGVIVSGIIPEGQMQTNMFDTIDRSKHDNLMKAMDSINRTMGKDVVRVGTQGFARHWWLKQEKLSQSYTTRWDQILTINV